MPDGLLYLVLVVVWAFVLIPMWLRKHDEANESRSVDRFSRALSSLSGRRDRKGQKSSGGAFLRARSVVMPGRPRGAQDPQVTVTGACAPEQTKSASAATLAGAMTQQRPEPRRALVVVAAGRRRRVLLGLLVVTVLVLAAGLLHKVPMWTAVAPALLLVAFVVSARRARMRTELVQRRKLQRQSLTEAARAAQTGRAAGARRRVRATDAVPAAASGVGIDLLVTATPGGVGAAAAVDERGWSAVPTTLPTYVTAPAATRVPRVIDRTTPGAWSGAAMLEQARTTRQESREDSGMRVESFEISVPRSAVDRPPVDRPATPAASAADLAGDTYSERYVDTSAGAAELDATDDESALSALLDDPRTGVSPQRRAYRRAAG
ncbi:MAG: hypothetical protein ABI468_05700 [Candidatus Nanopelagicales bacterium]